MKIVTINGSPRKNGCSEKLIGKIVEEVKEVGGEITSFMPNKMKIKGCQSCMACRKDNICVIKDDMIDIYEAIEDADVVVVGVPIYFHEMSAQLKMVFDRFYSYTRMDSNFKFSSTMKKGKKCVLVVSHGNHDENVYKEYAKSLEGKFKHVGFEEVEIFIASDSMSEHPEYLEACYEIGKNLKA